jgi:hypothetical protein
MRLSASVAAATFCTNGRDRFPAAPSTTRAGPAVGDIGHDQRQLRFEVDGMSRRARDWAWSCCGLTPALRCILLALAEHADEEGRCWPSLTRLAALTEVDRRTVTRGLAELEARALLTRERTRGQSTSYTLAIGEPNDCVTHDKQARETPKGETPLQQGCDTPG